MITAISLPESARRKVLPKHGMTLDEVIFAIGSEDLVRRMRKALWLEPVCKSPLLFDAGDVARCWMRIRNGEQP